MTGEALKKFKQSTLEEIVRMVQGWIVLLPEGTLKRDLRQLMDAANHVMGHERTIELPSVVEKDE